MPDPRLPSPNIRSAASALVSGVDASARQAAVAGRPATLDVVLDGKGQAVQRLGGV